MYIAFYLIFISIFIFKLNYPLFSFLEMERTSDILLNTLHPSMWWIMRMCSIGTIMFLYFSIIKKYKPSFFPQVILFTSPWLFILAREYNLYVISLFIIFSFYFIGIQKKFIYLFSIILFGILTYLYPPTFHTLHDKTSLLMSYFSIQRLFFQMEGESYYLYITKVGYFSLCALPLLMMGIVQYRKYRDLIVPFVLSTIFFFLYQTPHFIFAAAGFLLLLQLIILHGSDQIKKLSIQIIFIVVLLLSFSFFLEVYSRHYQKQFGQERGYLEYTLLERIAKNPQSKVYLPGNDSLKRLLKHYKYHASIPPIYYYQNAQDLTKNGIQCAKKDIICVFTKEELIALGEDKDSSKFESITTPSGLKMYFLE